ICAAPVVACQSVTSAGEVNTIQLTPFDPTKHQIRIPATLKGNAITTLVDTGLSSSAISYGVAQRLGIEIDPDTRFAVGGIGDQTVYAYDISINDLEVAGQHVDRLEGAADNGPVFDLPSPRNQDAILGYSFLKGRIAFVDYIEGGFALLSTPGEVGPLVSSCRKRHSFPLRFAGDDTIPIIPDFQIGPISGPVSLDTGSSSSLRLMQSPATRILAPLLTDEIGEVSATGARGRETSKRVRFPGKIGFGPFRLANQEVVITRQPGSPETRIANVGNRFMVDAGLKMLLDYKNQQITFFGDCKYNG
ncbi:MAG TPA: retropepsin-like aspartic protease, partial [Chloroflexota bacterium]|nr:retropepsin-like aspartic protease [Chloroflexota bacterium]